MAAPTSRVWDLPVRAFHWLLACSLLGSWITAEIGFEWMQWHFYLGYLALTLVLFRIIWGFVGTKHARFSNFLKTPGEVARYARSMPSKQANEHVGHNPLGGLAVVLMLLAVGAQATIGLFISDDIFWAGPYNGVVSGDVAGMLAGWHHTNFTLIQLLVITHLTAVCYYRLQRDQRLTSAMVTGRKLATVVPDDQAIGSSQLIKASLILVTTGACVTALIFFAPPPAVLDFY